MSPDTTMARHEPEVEIHSLLRFRRDDTASRFMVEVDRGTRGPVVPHTVLCGFLEHLSFSIVGGVSAEVLVNPTLVADPNFTPAQEAEFLANGRLLLQLRRSNDPRPFCTDWVSTPLATGFGVAVLDPPVERVPLGWSTASPGRIAPTVGRIGAGVRLHGAGVDLRQAVLLPIERTNDYVASVWGRIAPEFANAAGDLEVSLQSRGGLDVPVLAHASSRLRGADGWRQMRFDLVVPAGRIEVWEAVDMVLRWLPDQTGADLLVDRVSLVPGDAVMGLDPAVIARARKLGLARLRWPGGNFASTYRWRNGVGPLGDRPTEPNRAWGGVEAHLVGTDEYMAFCAAIDAEPHITVNTGTGTPEEAAAWVEYCNGSPDTAMGALRASNGHPEPHRVQVWELGNETYGAWQAGFHGAAENARRFSEFARAMRAASPIPLQLIACGNAFDFITPGPDFDHVCADGRWHDELLERAPNDIDVIALHALPMNDHLISEDDGAAQLAILAQVTSWERQFVPDLIKKCDASGRDPGRPPISIAMTEWGPLGAHPRRPMVENFGAVSYAAALLGLVIRNADRVTIASPNGFMHGGCLRKTGSLLFEDPLVTAQVQFLPFLGTTALATTISGPGYDVDAPADLGRPERDVPLVDVVVCSNPTTDALMAALGNRHPTDAIEVELHLVDGAWPTESMIVTMAAEEVGARATPAEPDRFRPRTESVPTLGGTIVVDVPASSAVWIYGLNRGDAS